MAESPVDQAGERRSPRIESLRAVAALGVLTGHVYAASVDYGPLSTDTFLHRVLLGGGMGVFLFFALSGYLLYRPFARRAYASGPRIDTGRYAANRALRILPLYYVAIVVLLILLARDMGPRFWVKFLLLLQSFYPDTVFKVDPPTWSLVVEVHFYILLPLFAVALARLCPRPRDAVGALLVVGLASLAARTALVYLPASPSPAWRYSLPTNFVFFIPGMLVALSEFREGVPSPVARGWMGRSTLWLLAAVALWLVANYNYRFEPLLLVASFAAVGGCQLPLDDGLARRVLEWRPLAILGVASYSLYIWHDPILGGLSHLAPLSHSYGLLMLVCVPVCCAVALVSYRFLEAPWLRLRRAWAASEEQRPLANAGN